MPAAPAEARTVLGTYRARRRAGLISQLAGIACPVCGEPPGAGCDRDYPDPATQVQIDSAPPLVLHALRIAAVLAACPRIRRLTLAQFGPNDIPEELREGT